MASLKPGPQTVAKVRSFHQAEEGTTIFQGVVVIVLTAVIFLAFGKYFWPKIKGNTNDSIGNYIQNPIK